MSQVNSIVGVFTSHASAETAVKELKLSGLNIAQVSIVGRDQHTEERVVGYYNAGDRMKYWGEHGAFWGGVWGLLFGAGFFWVPGLGPLLVAGPLVSMLVGVVEGAVVLGGLSAVGAGLYSLGIPHDSILQYESELKAGRFVLVFHGTTVEVEKAREVLEHTKADETKLFIHAPVVTAGA